MSNVYGDQQWRKLLKDACHLKRAAVDGIQTGDPINELRSCMLCVGVVATEKDVFAQILIEIG